MSGDFRHRVHALVARVPRGKVISYGAVAAMLGSPRAARGVGTALSLLGSDEVPWWRVVNRNGEVSAPAWGHTARIQRVLLESEGVEFDPRGRISWDRFGWQPDEPQERDVDLEPRDADLARPPAPSPPLPPP